MTTSDQRFKPLEAVLALAIVACVCPSFGAGAADPSQSNSSFARAVTIATVTRSCFVETLPVTGNVVPKAEVLVATDREGQLSQLLVEAGDTVTSGQVLARLKQPGGQGTASATDVQAPAAGVIYAAYATIGATVAPGSGPLFRIARDGEMELLADVPVQSMARLSPNQPVKVDIIGVGEIDGTVRSLSEMVNPTTQLGQVSVSLGINQQVRVGVFGRGTVELSRRCGPALPLSAVLYGSGSPVVQVIRNERVETRVVQVGQIKGGEAEIREGLSEGEIVAARAGAFVRDGDRVLPVKSPGI